MSDTRVVRWGILSTGRIAADFVSSSIHKVQQHQIKFSIYLNAPKIFLKIINIDVKYYIIGYCDEARSS